MKTALDITAVLYFVTVLFGAGLLGYLLWRFLFRVRGPTPLPPAREIPGKAMPEMERTLKQVEREYFASAGQTRTRLEHEKKRLENRLEKLRQRTFFDQQDYKHALRRREAAWNKWRTAHRDLVAAGGHAGPHLRDEMRAAEKGYRAAERVVEEEWHAAIARDLINFEELRGQEVLRPDVENALPETAPGDGEHGSTPDFPPAAPAPDDGDLNAATPPAGQAPGEEGSPPEPPQQTAPDAPQPPPAPGPPGDDLAQADFIGATPSGGGRAYRDETFALAPPDPRPQAGGATPDAAAPEGSPGGAVLRGARLPGCSFAGVRFLGVHRHLDCLYAGGDFSAIQLERRESPHQFSRCNFSGAAFSDARVAYTLFSHCDLSHTRWRGAVLERVKFDGCVLEGVDWEGADLSQTVVTNVGPVPPDFSTAGVPPHNLQAPAGQAAPGPAAESPEPPPSAPAGEESPRLSHPEEV